MLPEPPPVSLLTDDEAFMKGIILGPSTLRSLYVFGAERILPYAYGSALAAARTAKVRRVSRRLSAIWM